MYYHLFTAFILAGIQIVARFLWSSCMLFAEQKNVVINNSLYTSIFSYQMNFNLGSKWFVQY